MSKKKATVSKEQKAPETKKSFSIKIKKPTLKKIKIRIQKPDFSKIKDINWKPIVKIVGLVAIIVAGFGLIDLAVQYLNNDYSVAVVNGARIPKAKWYKAMESINGATVASQLIENEIITLEAKKSNVTASDEEITTKLNEIITQIGGQEMYQSALKANNLTEAELKDEIKLSILTTKILSPSITYTAEDVKNFFNQYSSSLFATETSALEKGAKLDYDQYKAKTEEYYMQQQIQVKKTSWIAEKKGQYRIQDNSVEKPKYGFLTTTINIINNLFNKK